MTPTDQQMADAQARLARIEALLRQLQGLLPPLTERLDALEVQLRDLRG